MPKTDPFNQEEIELLEDLFRADLELYGYSLPKAGDLPGLSGLPGGPS